RVRTPRSSCSSSAASATGDPHSFPTRRSSDLILSKKLATILLDCPVEFDEKDFELSKPDVEKTDAIFQELEFRQMKTQFDKLFGDRKSTRLNSSHVKISYAVFCSNKKTPPHRR